jgi:hypothetical protein
MLRIELITELLPARSQRSPNTTILMCNVPAFMSPATAKVTCSDCACLVRFSMSLSSPLVMELLNLDFSSGEVTEDLGVDYTVRARFVGLHVVRLAVGLVDVVKIYLALELLLGCGEPGAVWTFWCERWMTGGVRGGKWMVKGCVAVVAAGYLYLVLVHEARGIVMIPVRREVTRD